MTGSLDKDHKYGQLVSWLAVVLLVLCVNSCGGAAGTTLDATVPPPSTSGDVATEQPLIGPLQHSLPWPPPLPPLRSSSDDWVPLFGTDYISKGGDSSDSSPSLLLDSANGKSWAIYSMGGFSDTVVLDHVEVNFDLQADAAPGTSFYFGLSNYFSGTWEWYSGSPDTISLSPDTPQDFVSPAGSTYLAVVLNGGGAGQVDLVNFFRTGVDATPEAPQNLTGTASWFDCQLSWDPVSGPGKFHVYRSLNPDMSGAIRLTAVTTAVTSFTDTKVNAETDYYYAVTLLRGIESDYSNILPLSTTAAFLDVPQNLQAEVFQNRVELSWEPVLNATSYHIERCPEPHFLNQVQHFYADQTQLGDFSVFIGSCYFYRVQAQRGSVVSDFSDSVFAYIYETDLPAPQNLRLLNVSGDEAHIAWDWEGERPKYFRIYTKAQDNFAISPPFIDVGTVRADYYLDYHITGLPPNTRVWCRVCAMTEDAKFGRFTDTLPIDVPPYWSLDEPEMIGTGTGPVACVANDGDLSAAYAPQLGQIVYAKRDAGTWTTQGIGLDAGYGEYLGLSASGSTYIIYTQATLPDDLWCSEGPFEEDADGWRQFRIDGDGGTGLGTPQSGFIIDSTPTATQWTVAHIEATSDSLLYHTRDISGGPWTRSTIRVINTIPFYYSLAHLDGDVYALGKDAVETTVLFGNSGEDFAWTDISEQFDMGEQVGAHNDLTRYDSAWYSPSVEQTEGALSVIDNSSGTWVQTPVDAAHGYIQRCQMAAATDRLFMIYLANDPTEWYLAVLEQTDPQWSIQRLAFDGPIVGDYVAMAIQNDEACFVFDTREGNTIWCGKAIEPPAL